MHTHLYNLSKVEHWEQEMWCADFFLTFCIRFLVQHPAYVALEKRVFCGFIYTGAGYNNILTRLTRENIFNITNEIIYTILHTAYCSNGSSEVQRPSWLVEGVQHGPLQVLLVPFVHSQSHGDP